jgi:hypothetical protein
MNFFLYCKMDSSDELLKFLRKEELSKQEGQAIFFDVTYALNVCKQNETEKIKQQALSPRDMIPERWEKFQVKIDNMKKAQIILYGILGVFAKSVELALECEDTETAKEYANRPMEMKVSRDALEFIRIHSKLKVEDLLEEFPHEAKVEEMKQHLCQCLEDYEGKIEGLRKQIEKHSKNADLLRI